MVFDLASFGESALRLTVALLLGPAIGFERQVSGATGQVDRSLPES
jgi:uncharacterized membrane protein YhiD involved in acid resistance